MINRWRCQKCGNPSWSFWFWDLYLCKSITGFSKNPANSELEARLEEDYCYGSMKLEEKPMGVYTGPAPEGEMKAASTPPMKHPLKTYLRYAIWTDQDITPHFIAVILGLLFSIGMGSPGLGIAAFLLLEGIFLFRAWSPTYRWYVDGQEAGKIVRLRQEGRTIAEIASPSGVSKSTILNQVRVEEPVELDPMSDWDQRFEEATRRIER